MNIDRQQLASHSRHSQWARSRCVKRRECRSLRSQFNEAFVTAAFTDRGELEIHASKFNVDGDVAAPNHPIGATGAILINKAACALEWTQGGGFVASGRREGDRALSGTPVLSSVTDPSPFGLFRVSNAVLA